ncbi:DUF3080 family protein [Paraglaciecola sp. L3A3]|uniref:DUF3080 family protein n=1 Tax=Paraglaciecola sp. L3A3 TaxID=2686358 RepID=UPI001E519D0F|nr:DUF3080 family protein [Paraglaciecola sp. L3A3]
MILAKLIITMFVSCFLFSCNNNKQLPYLIDDYQQRLANIIDKDTPNLKQVSLAPYPHLAERPLNISETTIKLFEFYQLKPCQLYSLVAERNTTLGRLQLPSTRYLYEHQLLAAIGQCIQIINNEELLLKLKNWQQIKLNNITNVWAELIQNSSEMKYALSTNQHYVLGTAEDGISASKEAFHYLINLEQNQEINASELEHHLQQIKHFALPAKLWLSQTTLTKQLNQSTQWLKQHNHQLKCKNGRAETKVKYMANVFQLYFIEKIQPIASRINDYQYQLSPIFTQLSQQSNLSTSFTMYVKHHNKTGFSAYQFAMSQHIQFWQGLFKRCNIAPGSIFKN